MLARDLLDMSYVRDALVHAPCSRDERQAEEKKARGTFTEPGESRAFGEAFSVSQQTELVVHAFFVRCCGCIIAISLLYGHA